MSYASPDRAAPEPSFAMSRFHGRSRFAIPVLMLPFAVACGASAPGASEAPQRKHPVLPNSASPGDFEPEPEEDCQVHTSGYPGDCKAPPSVDPATGVVAHYGPSDYDDPDQVAAYVLQPGEEIVDCAYSTLGNTSEQFYSRYDVFSRPAMHHVILTTAAAAPADGFRDDCTVRDHGSQLLAVVQGGIRGSVYHYPPADAAAPENAGLGTRLAPHQSIAYELHAVNATETPLLRETWTVFHTVPREQVTETVGQLAFNGGLLMSIPAHTTQVIKNSCSLNSGLGPVRVVDFFGHMHAHGKRFSAWVSQTGAARLIYESYDWAALDLVQFNSLTRNPEPVYLSGKPGGMSGPLLLSPGDRIDYECEVDNTEDFALTFSARALTGEMCNLFGSFTPGSIWSCIGN